MKIYSRWLVVCIAVAAITTGYAKADDERSGGWATTVTGKTFTFAQQKKAPWFKDALKRTPVQYPVSEGGTIRQGSGMFHVSIDPKSGSVRNVTASKSTGFVVLDNAAIESLRHRRWRPGTWKEVELPVVFKASSDQPVTVGPLTR